MKMLAMILTGKIAKKAVYENLIQVKVAKAGFQKKEVKKSSRPMMYLSQERFSRQQNTKRGVKPTSLHSQVIIKLPYFQ